ncbi:MAG: Flp pilus assembly protein CpaB [Bryobacteraceae bacterium]|nr:Flp pilus assembly protein CpaB [Bryobacteraceae bacterium]
MGNLDRQKILMIFGGALVCAFLMSWFVYRNTVAPKTEKMVKVVAAARDMAAGTRLKGADVKLVTVAEKDLPKSAMADLKLAEERVLLFPVNANEPISANKLSGQAGVEGLASTIEPGKRAVSVPFNDSSGAGGLVQPRSHVDVLFTRTGSMNEAVTTVVLENVVVLAIGRNTEVGSVAAPAASGGSTTTPSSSASRAATLLVTPQQAAKLEFARQQGKISLALRNPLDSSVSTDEDVPVITATDVKVGLGPRRLANGRIAGRVPNLRDDQVWDGITAAPRTPPKPKPEPKEPPKPKFVVDVYRGDKHVQEIFQ